MIHDVFFRRYPAQMFWGQEAAMHQLFVQIAHILFGDVTPTLGLDGRFFRTLHDALARELGQGRLAEGEAYDEICGRFLVEPYNLWNDHHGTLDGFLKIRFSFVELAFRAIEELSAAKTPNADRSSLLGGLFSKPTNAPDQARVGAAVRDAIRELNDRFRQAGTGLHYHNGLIQFARDEAISRVIAEPSWSLLRDRKWANVDRELKEAFDSADSGRADAAFHAAKGLESTIRIICEEKGLTTGRERGAANLVDALASQKNGRFLEPWEGDMLKAFFTHVRNPYGHGAGSQPPPVLTPEQTEWAIESAMSWIKNLVRRM